MIPPSFVERITQLGSASGHIAIKIKDVPNTVSSADAVQRFFCGTGSARVACAKRDLAAGTKCSEIVAINKGVLELAVEKASGAQYAEFWAGKNVSADRTVAAFIEPKALVREPVVQGVVDPFVMENIGTFAGKRGRDLIATMRDERPQSVIAAIIGPPDEMFLFANNETLLLLIPAIFSTARTSETYSAYANGSFAPIDVALARIARRHPKS